MKIETYKKIKNNEYELIIDNGTVVKLYDNTILRYNLLIKKEFSEREFKEITQYNDEQAAYYLSLKYLNKKLRTKLEIEKYLKKKEFNSKSINQAIKRLTDEGYLNNKKFAESYINDEYNLTNNGPGKIKYNLIKLGISEDEIIIDKDFSFKIEKLINKKIKLNNKLSTYALKLNITNYLINLGYPQEMFINYLEDITVDDSNLIKKDYEILKKKYARKYDKYKLESFIKDKLYKKGYQIEAINSIFND